MKKTFLFFALFFLGTLVPQITYSEEPSIMEYKRYSEKYKAYSEEERHIMKYGKFGVYSEEPRIIKLLDPYSRRYVLWRVYTQPIGPDGKVYVTVDSVLRENFYAKEKISLFKKGEKNINKIIDPNNYYLVLATIGCSEESAAAGKCFLAISEIDYIIPDTPENREFLSKKWDETTVIYQDPKPMPRIKGRDIDM